MTINLGDFFSKIDQGARKVQLPYLKHLASMAKDPKQAWRLALPGDNETTKFTNKLTGRDDKPWQGSFSEGLGLPSWYKDEVRGRGDGEALGYDHKMKGAVGAVVGAFLGNAGFSAMGGSGGAAAEGGTAGAEGAGSSSPSWMKWAKMGAQMGRGLGGGGGQQQAQPEAPDVAGDFAASTSSDAARSAQWQAKADADNDKAWVPGAGFKEYFGGKA